METIIPYLMALAGFFLINKGKSNRIVTVLFVFFYSLNLLFNMKMNLGPDIYLVELALITCFFVSITLCISVLKINVTMMVLVICAIDIVIAVMDIVAFVSYYSKGYETYAFVYDGIIQLAVIQYAALWVNDARGISIRALYDNIKLHVYNLAVRALYR